MTLAENERIETRNVRGDNPAKGGGVYTRGCRL
jgi:hypothetical protein